MCVIFIHLVKIFGDYIHRITEIDYLMSIKIPFSVSQVSADLSYSVCHILSEVVYWVTEHLSATLLSCSVQMQPLSCVNNWT